jgi:fibronectin type 3 domain-containing protein
VRATDAAGNLSAYSSTASATTTAAIAIAYVQSNSVSPSTTVSTMSAPFTAAQAAGDLIVVGLSWGGGVTVSSVTDTKGNTYALAVGPTTFSGAASAIYYAKNIVAAAAGANTVTVTFSAATGTPDLRIAEYSGINTTSPLDVTSASTGTSATSSSGAATTANANDLLVGANAVLSGTAGAGAGFTSRQISTFDGNILEDRVVSATGAYSATATLSSSAAWIMQMAAFKGAGGSTDTIAPSTPTGVSAVAASSTQVNVSWTASTDNVAVTGYLLERCQGASCTSFAQIASPTTTSFSDTGRTASTSYSYRVRAQDASGNFSGYSSTASATTPASGGDTTAPAAPTSLSATAASGSQINLSWTASTDNIGVTGYQVERCQGAGCSTFSQIATPTGTSYSNTGLSAATSYSYRVRATDAAMNLSGYSNVSSASTSGGTDNQAPTAPGSLTVFNQISSEVDLTWTAATDNVAVTGYLIERCQGDACSTVAQVGTSLTAGFSDMGLLANTHYSYRVRARDDANNMGLYSNIISTVTPVD